MMKGVLFHIKYYTFLVVKPLIFMNHEFKWSFFQWKNLFNVSLHLIIKQNDLFIQLIHDERCTLTSNFRNFDDYYIDRKVHPIEMFKLSFDIHDVLPSHLKQAFYKQSRFLRILSNYFLVTSIENTRFYYEYWFWVICFCWRSWDFNSKTCIYPSSIWNTRIELEQFCL